MMISDDDDDVSYTGVGTNKNLYIHNYINFREREMNKNTSRKLHCTAVN